MDPGQKVAFVPGPKEREGGDRGLLSRVEPPTRTKGPLLSGLVAPLGTKGPTLLSRVVTPTGTKGDPFVPVGVTNPDKRPLHVIVQKKVILY